MKQIKAREIGLLTGVLMIGTSLFSFYKLHLPLASNFQLLVYSIFSAGIIWALLNHYKSVKPDKSFNDYFSEGFKAFIVMVLLMVVYTYIFVKVNPSIIDGFIIENNKLLSAEGNRTVSEIKDNEDKIRKSFLQSMVMGATIIYLVIGALITTIGAGYLSSKQTNENKN